MAERLSLASHTVAAGQLLQHVSRVMYRGRPLHYSREASNRYDCPDRGYGVLYLAFDLATALMETMFHDHRWHRGGTRAVTLQEVDSRMVRAVGVLQDLHLADLTDSAALVRQHGLNLSQLASRRYVHTQRLSAAVHAAPAEEDRPAFDGIVYPSRNHYPATAVALFSRAGNKVDVIADIDLAEHANWPEFVRDYGIGIVPAQRRRPGRR